MNERSTVQPSLGHMCIESDWIAKHALPTLAANTLVLVKSGERLIFDMRSWEAVLLVVVLAANLKAAQFAMCMFRLCLHLSHFVYSVIRLDLSVYICPALEDPEAKRREGLTCSSSRVLWLCHTACQWVCRLECCLILPIRPAGTGLVTDPAVSWEKADKVGRR